MLDPHFWSKMINIFSYGVASVILFIIMYKILDWFTYRVDFHHELVNEKNVAVGIKVGAMILGICIIIAAIIAS